jgi:hypothetical protein
MVILVSVLALITLSCSGKSVEPTSDATEVRGSYDLIIGTGKVRCTAQDPHTCDSATVLLGQDVDTNWAPEDGFIYLGADEQLQGKPIGTLTMTIAAPIFDEDEGLLLATVLDAVVSKTDARCGTAAELNAKLYGLLSGEVFVLEIGANFINGFAELRMEKVSPRDGETELVDVTGPFTALDGNAAPREPGASCDFTL